MDNRNYRYKYGIVVCLDKSQTNVFPLSCVPLVYSVNCTHDIDPPVITSFIKLYRCHYELRAKH